MIGAMNSTEAQDDPLAHFRWKARVLIVLSADPASPALAEQKRQCEILKSGASERDLVLVQALADSPEAKVLRARLSLGNRAFWAVLVGKDGRAKLTAAEPISAQDLATTIDAMPMRQDEMHRRAHPRAQ
jgi:hypothetical protein